MGGRLSVDECTSTDNQRVRDCCHLEGETPIEIRIAYQQPRPPQRLANFTHSNGALAGVNGSGGAVANAAGIGAPPSSSFAHGSLAGASLPAASFPAPSTSPLEGRGFGAELGGSGLPLPTFGSGRSWQQTGDAERPPMPRGADRLRLPPPGGNAITPKQASGDEFDPDTFAAPPDSERGENSALAQTRLNQALALKVLQMQQEEDYFPEIVRVSNGYREGPPRGFPGGGAAAAAAAAATMDTPDSTMCTPRTNGLHGGSPTPPRDGESPDETRL